MNQEQKEKQHRKETKQTNQSKVTFVIFESVVRYQHEIQQNIKIKSLSKTTKSSQTNKIHINLFRCHYHYFDLDDDDDDDDYPAFDSI